MCIDNDSIKTDTLPDGERPNSLEDLVQAPSNSPWPHRSKSTNESIDGNRNQILTSSITIKQIIDSGIINPAQMGDLSTDTPSVATSLSPLAIKSIHNSLAPGTWRSYITLFMQFNIWCIVNGISSLPTTPDTVSNYLSELAHLGKKHVTLQGIASAIAYFHRCLEIQSPTDSQKVRSTLRGIGRMDDSPTRQADPLTPEVIRAIRRVAREPRIGQFGVIQGIASAIAYFHRCLEIQSPTDSQKVRSTLRGIGRMDDSPTRQADPLTPEVIRAIRRVAREPRIGQFGVMESPESALHRGLIDIALCSTLLFAGLRRMEAISLTWADVEPQEDGSGLIIIRRSKTTQFGEQQIVAIPDFVLADIEAIRPSHTDSQERVFRLGAQQINSRIKRAVAAAGITGTFSSHSGRVGMAIYLQKRGAPDHIIRRQGRWKDGRMIDRYTKRARASLVLPYFDQDQ